MSAAIEQFKQETFSLIKEQATRLKTHSKELEIKEEQIRLLKETIQALEDERDDSERTKATLRHKIDVIMKEVASYNENVVQKIHAENETLSKRVSELVPQLEQALQTIRALSKQLAVCEETNTKLNAENLKAKDTVQSLSAENQKYKQQINELQQSNTEYEKQVNKLEAVNEQQESKLRSFDKQIESLVAKCQETVSGYERKIKQIKETHVKKQEIARYEEEVARIGKKVQAMAKENEKMSREKGEVMITLKSMRERAATESIKLQMDRSLIESDLRVLKESCRINKKISEFQSSHSQLCYSILEPYLQMASSCTQKVAELDLLKQQVSQLEKSLIQKQAWLSECKTQMDIMSEKLKHESETLEAAYEGKILQLSIKIKKEEKALQELSIRDRDFHTLHEQYEKVCADSAEMKAVFQNTLTQQKKQNEKLTGELQQLLQICDDNINTQNSLNCVKHSLNNLLAIIFYLHLSIVRSRELRRKVYHPFIEFYVTAKNVLDSSRGRSRAASKFRAAVVVVIAIRRMQKSAKEVTEASIYRYAQKAIKQKGKIQDLGVHLEKLLQATTTSQTDIVGVLKQNKSHYRWNCLPNYLRVNIPTNWFSRFAASGK